MFVALCHDIVNNMAYFHMKVSAFVAVNTRISFNAGEIFVIIYQPFKNNIILFSCFNESVCFEIKFLTQLSCFILCA